jgi:CxxC motif-containing protein
MGKVVKKKKKPSEQVVLSEPTRRYTCIVCPNCCELETDGSGVVGARCPRGEDFARQEWVSPLRVITTTLRVHTPEGVRLLPVKTAGPVPLARIMDIMKGIKALRLTAAPPIGSRVPVETLSEPLELIITGE